MSEPKIMKFSEVAKLSPADTLKLLESDGKIVIEIQKDVFLHMAAPTQDVPVSPTEEASKIGSILLSSVDKTVKAAVQDHFTEVSNRIDMFFGMRKAEFDAFMEQAKTESENDLSAARAAFDRQIDAINDGLIKRLSVLGDELSGVIAKVSSDLGEARATEIRAIEERMRQSIAEAAAVIATPIPTDHLPESFDLPVDAHLFGHMLEGEEVVVVNQLFDPVLEAVKLADQDDSAPSQDPLELAQSVAAAAESDAGIVFVNIDTDANEAKAEDDVENIFLDLRMAEPSAQVGTFAAAVVDKAEENLVLENALEGEASAEFQPEVTAPVRAVIAYTTDDEFDDLLASFKQSASTPEVAAPAKAEAAEEDFSFLLGVSDQKSPSKIADNTVELEEQAKEKGYSFDI